MNTRPLIFSRRNLLIGAGGLGVLSAFGLPNSARAAGDDYDQILANWRAYALGVDIDPTVDVIRAAIDDLDSRVTTSLGLLSDAPNAVFTDLILLNEGGAPESGRPATSFLRLKEMAEAYHTPGSAFEGSAEIRDVIVAGTAKVHERVYHAGQAPFGNWWFWEVGAAQRVLSICALMGEEVMGADLVAGIIAAIDHFIRDEVVENRLASARMHACQSIFLRGALGRSAERIEYARTKLLEAFVYVESGRGFYPDGSLVDHDNIAYTGTYGSVFLQGFVINSALILGTQWQLDGAASQFGLDLVNNAFSPLVHDGLVFDNVRGRAIGRPNANSRDDGHALVAAIAQLSDTLSGQDQVELRERVRGWMERDPGVDPRLADPAASTARTFSEVVSLNGIWLDDSLQGAPEPIGTQVFGGMARAVHRQPGWATAISMSTHRIAHYEAYQENLRGWHTGSGMVTLANDDPTHYTDNYWPTVDPYHLPGTTVDQIRLADGQNGDDRNKDLSAYAWAGGAVLDSFGAAIGMEFDGFSSTLTAKKSWFAIGDKVVCLGSDINKSMDALTLVPEGDAHVSAATPDDNFGDAQIVYLKRETSECYIRFASVAGLDDPSASAELSFRAYVETPGARTATLSIHAVDSDWDESTVTWNTRPGLGEQLGTLVVGRAWEYHSLELSDYVRARAAQGGPIDIAVVVQQTNPADDNVEVTFNPRLPERTQPYLSVLRPGTTEVHTTLENRLDHEGEQRAVAVDGEATPAGTFEMSRSGRFWAHLDQVGGYISLDDAGSARIARTSREGRWADINPSASADEITREYVSIVLNHGVGPTAAGYAYVMLPQADLEEVAAFADAASVDVLARDAAQHAVLVDGVTAVNFWQPGTVGAISVDVSCAVVFARTREGFRLAVSRPDFSTEPVTVRVRGGGYRGVSFNGGATQAVARDGIDTVVTVPIQSIGRTTEVTLQLR